MRNFLAIVAKELRSFFTSFTAYAVLAVFFFVIGLFFFLITTSVVTSVLQQVFASQQTGSVAPPVDAMAIISRSYFGLLSTILLFIIPMITMGVFSEEKKRGTMELLMTSPIRNVELILGKFCAVLIFLSIMLVPSLVNLLVLYIYTDPRPLLAPILTGYLGAFLLGGALMALGLFVSTLTENQIVAAVVTWGLFILLWVLDAGTGAGTTLISDVLGYVSILNHYDDFARGIIDTQNVVFYLSFIFLGLYLTAVSLESMKWRQ